MERNMRTWTKLKRVRAKKKMKNPIKEVKYDGKVNKEQIFILGMKACMDAE
jgi:hypothetical protein